MQRQFIITRGWNRLKSYRGAAEYGYINTRIRGNLSRFLTARNYEALMQSNSYDDFMKTLKQSYYGTVIETSGRRTPSPEILAILLSRHFADTIMHLSKGLSGKVSDFVDAYMNLFLIESLKTIVRGIHAGLAREEILGDVVSISPNQEILFETLASVSSK
jgi:vacuolar-type H+-ATPase subunit C/Vma6